MKHMCELIDPPEDIQNQPEAKNSEATPTKDITETADSDIPRT
jgi:hypothetical protein